MGECKERLKTYLFINGELPKRLKGRAWKARRSVTRRQGSKP